MPSEPKPSAGQRFKEYLRTRWLLIFSPEFAIALAAAILLGRLAQWLEYAGEQYILIICVLAFILPYAAGEFIRRKLGRRSILFPPEPEPKAPKSTGERVEP